MKVAYVIMQFPAPSETFASSDVRILKEMGVDVSVYALRAAHVNHRSLTQQRGLEAVNICSVGFLRNLVGLFYTLTQPALFFSLLTILVKKDIRKVKHFFKMLLLIPSSFYIFQQIKNNPPDVVHLFWGHYPSLVGFLLMEKLPSVKVTMFLGAYDLEYSLGISVYVANKVHALFTHAYFNIGQLKASNISNPNTYVVHRGVDVSRLLKVISEGGRRVSNTWLSAGRLLRSKGFDEVIKLFQAAGHSGGSAALIIAGDGPERSALLNMISRAGMTDDVRLVGHLAHEKLVGLMASSDFFFLLSAKPGERLPNAIKEAMLSGAICFTTRTPGIEELIEHEVTGFIVDHANQRICLDLIKSLTLDKKEKIRVAAFEHIVEKFDARKNMDKYVSLWSRL